MRVASPIMPAFYDCSHHTRYTVQSGKAETVDNNELNSFTRHG